MKERVEQLDGLRGIFAVFVIAHHHNAFKESLFYNNFFVINANLFVDFFFVLSGFVIARNYVNRIHNAPDFFTFLRKRFIRLYPLLLYTEVVFIIANLLGEGSPLKNAGDLGLGYYLYTALDTLTFMGSTPVFGSWMSINYPAWSISAEMIAYLVFGLVVLFFYKKKYIVFALLTLLSGVFILSRGEYLLAYDFGFVRGIFCFMLGVFTNRILAGRRYNLSVLEWPFVLVLILGMFAVQYWQLNLWKMVFPFLFAAGIMIFASSSGAVTQLLASKPFQYLGRISYSIYLNHAIVLIFVNIVLFRLLKLPVTEPMIGVSLLASITLTIVYSHFTYLWIERGVGRLLNAKLSQSTLA